MTIQPHTTPVGFVSVSNSGVTNIIQKEPFLKKEYISKPVILTKQFIFDESLQYVHILL